MEINNIILALSNVYAILPIIKSYNLGHYLMTFTFIFAGLGSFLYHLSEQKHGLPGIYPFNLVTWKLLWIDRIGAISAIISVFIYGNNYIEIIKYGSLALLILFISEKLCPNPWPFVPIHVIWHMMAFHIGYIMI